MLTCAELFTLAETHAPIMHYAVGPQPERFFPVEAETWLTHCSPDNHATPGTHKRGTALYNYVWDPNDPANEPWIGSAALASCQGPGPVENRKCSGLSLDATQVNRYIGAAGLRNDPDYFLDFGGWQAPSNAQAGDLEYLREVVAGLLGGPAGTPTPQPVYCFDPKGPAWYAEFSWAAAWASPESDKEGRFAPQVRKLLAPYLALTYHMLYPAMDKSFGQSAARNREGQWEALTIFFRDGILWRKDREISPKDFSIQELQPVFVAYSRSYTAGGSPRQIVRPWPQIAKAGDPPVHVEGNTHPVSWVTLGTHKNMWKPLTVPVTIPEEVPNPDLIIAAGVVLAAAAAAAGFCTALCLGALPFAVPGWLTCAACWLITGIIALIALLLLLFAFLCKSRREKSENKAAEDPLPVGDETDLFNGTGTSGGAPAGTPGAPAGAQGFTLRVVDNFNDIPETSAYPPPARTCERPVWWRYAGRWGVQMTARTPGLSWDSGTRLSDEFGRSRAYYNTLELVNFTQTTDPAQRGSALEPQGEPVPSGAYEL